MLRRMMLLVEEEEEMGWTTDGIANRSEPNGDLVIKSSMIDGYAFYGSRKITSVYSETVNYFNGNCFMNCTGLQSVSIPKAIKLGGSSFRGCTALVDAHFPKSTTIEQQLFYGCTALQIVELGSGGIPFQCFYNCTNLGTLIIRNTSISALSNVKAFTGTPFASGGTGGTIYVPEALIEDYKVANKWADIYDLGTLTFAPIEGSEYE